MIRQQGPSPGRTPPPADTAPTAPLTEQMPPPPEPSTPSPHPGTEYSVPSDAAAEHETVPLEPAGNPEPEDEHKGVDLARLAWLATAGACAIAVAILLVEGYYGYAAVTLAVAASAALNLT
jgi:hypothetical protein